MTHDPTSSAHITQPLDVSKHSDTCLRGVKVVYLLHSGELFGTERMALATLDGFGAADCVTISPQGPFLSEAASRGYKAVAVSGAFQLLRVLFQLIRSHRQLVFISTTVLQAFMISWVNLLFRRRIAHLHVVHGGDDEFSSYGRKKWLNFVNVSQIAVSDYVREMLVRNGVRPSSIFVIDNFLSEKTLRQIRRKESPSEGFRGRGLVVARLVVHKRIELLIDTFVKHRSKLEGLTFDIFGKGDLARSLESKARQADVPLQFMGYGADLVDRVADYDFLVHLNHEEPFGIVVLEAMAAGIPVLVPDKGGAATIVRDQKNGFKFRSNCVDDLAMKLEQLRVADSESIRSIVAAAHADLQKRYSERNQIAAYQRVIAKSLG